LRLIFTMS